MWPAADVEDINPPASIRTRAPENLSRKKKCAAWSALLRLCVRYPLNAEDAKTQIVEKLLWVQEGVDLSLHLTFLDVVIRVQSPQVDSCKIIVGVFSLDFFNRASTAVGLRADSVEKLLRCITQVREIAGREVFTASVGLHVHKIHRIQ